MTLMAQYLTEILYDDLFFQRNIKIHWLYNLDKNEIDTSIFNLDNNKFVIVIIINFITLTLSTFYIIYY